MECYLVGENPQMQSIAIKCLLIQFALVRIVKKDFKYFGIDIIDLNLFFAFLLELVLEHGR